MSCLNIQGIFLPLKRNNMDSVMAKRGKRQTVTAEMLSKEFLCQFKIEDDTS